MSGLQRAPAERLRFRLALSSQSSTSSLPLQTSRATADASVMSPIRSRVAIITAVVATALVFIYYTSSSFQDQAHPLNIFHGKVLTGADEDAKVDIPPLAQQQTTAKPASPTPTPTTPPAAPPPAPPSTAPKVGQHAFRSDGLLEVNPAGEHPVYTLIERAEMEWKAKLARASRTFEDAVKEYQRRYKRNPPKGFNVWWDYVQKHNVQLPDEYDQIYEDLEPFWGLDPVDLNKNIDALSNRQDTFTMGNSVEDKTVKILKTALHPGGEGLIGNSIEILALLNDHVKEFLPTFKVVVSPHDDPDLHWDWRRKDAALKAAQEKRVLRNSDLPPPVTNIGWAASCSSTSPAYSQTIDYSKPPPSQVHGNKSFIYDHRLAMDACYNPNLFWHHGTLIRREHPNPEPMLLPLFSTCSTSMHQSIRIARPYGWAPDFPDNPEFDNRTDERLIWRGTVTGLSWNSWWKKSHRMHTVLTTNDRKGTLDIIPSQTKKGETMHPYKRLKKSYINPAMMNVALTNKPVEDCEGICAEYTMDPDLTWRERVESKERANYKYVFDVDGNGWSGRFKRLITTKTLPFKASLFPEWFTDRVAPWLHYIPVQLDLSDLHDALIFFRGDGNGEGAHEDLAKKIADAGREWSQTFWREEDMAAYFFRLILEYSRVVSLDRQAMTM